MHIDENGLISGSLNDMTIHAAGTDEEGQEYNATYTFTDRNVDILDLFGQDGDMKDIDGNGEVNEYDLVDFMLKHIEGATLEGVNLPPHAYDDTVTIDNKTHLLVDAANGLLANDPDWEGDALQVSSFNFWGISYSVGELHELDGGVSMKINEDGSYEFNPGQDAFSDLQHSQSRSGSIEYSIVDEYNTCSDALLTITVSGANNAPTVGTTPLVSEATEGGAVYNVDLLEGASDEDGDSLSVTDVTYDATADTTCLAFDGNTRTIDPDGNLADGTDYYVTIDDGSVLDLASNPYDYEDEEDAFHFSTLDAAVAATGDSDGVDTGAVIAGVAGVSLLAYLIL